MIVLQRLVISVLMGFHFSASAGIVSYLDRATWQAALGNPLIISDDFNQSSQSFIANSSDNVIGYSSLSLVGGVGDPGPTGFTGSGYLQGEVDYAGADKLSLEFSFEGLYGFALVDLINDSLNSPSNLNLSELAIKVGSEQFSLSALLGVQQSAVAFLGFTSTELITGFTLFHGKELGASNNVSEEFYLGELMFARQAVPEPSSWWLILFGLMLLMFRQPRALIIRA